MRQSVIVQSRISIIVRIAAMMYSGVSSGCSGFFMVQGYFPLIGVTSKSFGRFFKSGGDG